MFSSSYECNRSVLLSILVKRFEIYETRKKSPYVPISRTHYVTTTDQPIYSTALLLAFEAILIGNEYDYMIGLGIIRRSNSLSHMVPKLNSGD